MTTVIESCRISPPAEAAGELLVPLSLFDMKWVPFHPIRHLLFYEYPCSESSFMESLVPQLKQSLSLTLKQYLPAAGNLLYPLNNGKKPVLRYATGDSVCLTIAKSSNDFVELTGNHARDADQFYDFVPPMLSTADDDDLEYRVVPLIALQATLFPGRGICLGLSLRHCLGDASSIQGFVSAWAAMNKDSGDKEGLPLPTFDRSVIRDAYGIDAILWEEERHAPFDPAPCFPIPTNRVRATFTLRQGDINKLKAKKPAASSFAVTTSYVWSCLAKSGGEEVEEDESRLLIFSADARRLMNPPVPANYFGNCLAPGVVILEHKKLVAGDDQGFIAAAQGIADAVSDLVKVNKDEFIKSAKDWPSELTQKFEGIRATMAVAGSPKFDFGAVDFGWGKLRSQELVSMDGEKYSIFLSKSMDEEGGLEVGLSLPRDKMEAFAATFADGLRS